MRLSDEIFQKNRNSMSKALEEVRKIQDPKLRDETTQRLTQNFALFERAERDRTENLHRQATDIIEAQGSVDKIPPALWKQFSLSERSSLRSYAQARAEGKDIKTDWESYYNLRTMAAQPQLRDKFMQENLLAYRSQLGNSEFKELVDLQSGLRSGDGKAAEKADGIMTDRQIIDSLLESAGFDTGSKASKADKRAVSELYRQIDEQIKTQFRATGKRHSTEDTRRIAESLLVEGVTKKGIIFDTKKRVFELEPGENLELDVEDVPRGERRKIEDALRRAGRPVNDQTILSVYSQRVESLRNK